MPEWVGRTALRFAAPEGRASTIDSLLKDPIVVETPNGSIRFLGVGRLSFGRARKLLTKEPDSLKWIDQMAPGSVFWDIGANIGSMPHVERCSVSGVLSPLRQTTSIWWLTAS